MAVNDSYLRPDAGDGINGARLRPDGISGQGGDPGPLTMIGLLLGANAVSGLNAIGCAGSSGGGIGLLAVGGGG